MDFCKLHYWIKHFMLKCPSSCLFLIALAHAAATIVSSEDAFVAILGYLCDCVGMNTLSFLIARRLESVAHLLFAELERYFQLNFRDTIAFSRFSLTRHLLSRRLQQWCSLRSVARNLVEVIAEFCRSILPSVLLTRF